MPNSNELKLERCAPTESVAERRKEEKKEDRVNAEDGIQPRSKKPRFLRPMGFLGGTGGVHFAFETAGVPSALELAYRITRRGGTTIAAGMPGPDASITLPHLSLAAEERTIKGSYMGSCVPSRDIPRYIGLYKDHKLPIDRLTSHQIEFGELNEAFDRMVDGEALRQVLVL